MTLFSNKDLCRCGRPRHFQKTFAKCDRSIIEIVAVTGCYCAVENELRVGAYEPGGVAPARLPRKTLIPASLCAAEDGEARASERAGSAPNFVLYHDERRCMAALPQ